jgi:nucleotide-binding universal stress UspA family protein
MIILAHDGSLYGDWVARYAVRFAAAEADRKLLLLHVLDGRIEPAIAEARLARLGEECAAAGVICHRELLPLGQSVHRALRQATPHEPAALLVCGTRVKPRHQAFLTGSVAELLLRGHQCPVLALRVVQPGLLGLPHDLLLPLAGHPDGGDRLEPILRRFAPQLRKLHLLHALPVHSLAQPHQGLARREQLRQTGHRYLDRIHAHLAEKLALRHCAIDCQVLLAVDPAHQILVEASRLKAQMLLLGASERSLAHRVFHGRALEQILRETPCDVGIYRVP